MRNNDTSGASRRLFRRPLWRFRMIAFASDVEQRAAHRSGPRGPYRRATLCAYIPLPHRRCIRSTDAIATTSSNTRSKPSWPKIAECSFICTHGPRFGSIPPRHSRRAAHILYHCAASSTGTPHGNACCLQHESGIGAQILIDLG